MPRREVPGLIELLREALEQLERIEGIPPDDPALVELKKNIVLLIAELGILKNGRAAAA